MIWHITKREIYDNLNSLRFAFTVILLLALMLTNAIVYLQEHPGRMQKYFNDTVEARKKLEARSTSLYRLTTEGPGRLYKAHSPLRFCAEGDEGFLSTHIRGENYVLPIANLKPMWRLSYPQQTPNIHNVRPNFTTLDWVFIVSYVLSFVSILFTFDTVSGELERGTLRLILANSIPRHTVLIGKFLGAFISINIPFAIAVLMNLLLISSSDMVQLNTEMWGRLGILCLIIFLYTSLFIAIGILVSAAARESGISLVVLLLIWVSFVVFLPNTLASIGSQTAVPMRYLESWWQGHQHGVEVRKVYQEKYGDAQTAPPVNFIAEYIQKEAKDSENFNQTYLQQQIKQGKHARVITRISPAAIVKHLFESFAGTGIERHLQFIDNVKRYAQEYREFVIDTDRADPTSLHAIGVPKGMSNKPVNPDAIPTFQDTMSLNRDFNAATIDILLLLLFLVLLSSGAFLIFVNVEV